MSIKRKTIAMNMQSWSDQFLDNVNSWANIIGIIGAAFVLVSVAFIYLTTSEQSRRAKNNESIAKQAEDIKSQRLEKTEAQLAEAIKRANDASALAAQLEEKQTPRTLTDEQRQRFISALVNAPKGEVEVHIFNQDSEITQYANQIKAMLTAAGYDTKKMVGISFGSSATPAGVIIVIKDPTAQPPFAGPIQSAFAIIGINAKAAIDPTMKDVGKVMVVVGTKE